MGPILQYVFGVPIGLGIFFWGLYGAYHAFTRTAEEEQNNGFGAGVAFLFAVGFGAAILWAILIEGLHFGGSGRYY